MEIHPFSALFLLVQSRLTDAANAIFSDYCFTDTHLKNGRLFCVDSREGGEKIVTNF